MTSYRAAARVDADRKVHFEAFDAELFNNAGSAFDPVSYTHLRAHET